MPTFLASAKVVGNVVVVLMIGAASTPESGFALHKLYRVADLSSVWLMLDLFPDDASAVRFGQQVEAEIQSMPGEVFTGRVAFIDPTVNPKTRTVRVRVEIMNFDGKLRPGDYAVSFVNLANAGAQVTSPIAVCSNFRPKWLTAVADAPGVLDTTIEDALRIYA